MNRDSTLWTNTGKRRQVMPSGDRSGPLGEGPRTGRGAGYCSGYGRPGYANGLVGGRFGGGRGRGGGRGWRHWYHATGLTGWQRGRRWQTYLPEAVADTAPTVRRDAEIELLRADLRCLQEHAAQITQRIEELTGDAPADERT